MDGGSQAAVITPGAAGKSSKLPQKQKLRWIILKDPSPEHLNKPPAITVGWWQCGRRQQSPGAGPGSSQDGCREVLGQTLPWLPVPAGAGAGQRDRQGDQTSLQGRERRLPESRSSPARAVRGSTRGAAGERSWQSLQDQPRGAEAGARPWQARTKTSFNPHPHFILSALKSPATLG